MRKTRREVLDLAEEAVNIKSKYGHSDVGDTLVLMLQGKISTDEAYQELEGLSEDYKTCM